MEDDNSNADAEANIEIGESAVRLKGSESFVKDELSNFRDWIEDNDAVAIALPQKSETESSKSTDSTGNDPMQAPLPTTRSDSSVAVGEQLGPEEGSERSKIEEVADSINVKPRLLSNHFYIDEDGIGIQDPRSIEPEYALLGYGIIKKELTGETYLDNTETKKKLIDQEMLDIDRWGGKFIHGLRRRGLIKDDPNTDRQRNRPFKITPKGLDHFISWLENEA